MKKQEIYCVAGYILHNKFEVDEELAYNPDADFFYDCGMDERSFLQFLLDCEKVFKNHHIMETILKVVNLYSTAFPRFTIKKFIKSLSKNKLYISTKEELGNYTFLIADEAKRNEVIRLYQF